MNTPLATAPHTDHAQAATAASVQLATAAHAADPLFEFLDQAHQRIAQHLDVLLGVVQAAQRYSFTEHERAQAQKVLAFFDREGRQHHLDEETHVFPALKQSADPQVRHVAARLEQDHGWIEEDWLVLEPMLRQIAQDSVGLEWAEFDHAAHVYVDLVREHMAVEEQLAYPQARADMGNTQADLAGREMARRRANLALRAAGR
jgi:hemerythrin-like domain-containing protein